MASIVLSNIGSAVGNRILPGIGGRILGALGSRAGKYFDREIGWADSAGDGEGRRIEGISVQDSRYGAAIPLIFGTCRVAGNVIWISDLIETSHESGGGGGKGGFSSGGTRTTYSYSVHCAVALCHGEIGGIGTIWADSKPIYQNGIWKQGVVGAAAIYKGTDTQSPDAFLESMLGAGEVPAYRGVAYVVFESLQLADFGNRLPNLTFEVLPAVTSINPVWCGCSDAVLRNRPTSLRNGGITPLILESGSVRARKVLVGGYSESDSAAKFVAACFDVTGDVPKEMFRAESAEFPRLYVNDHSWALSPDRKFAVFCLQDSQASPVHNFALYDARSNAFGNVLSLAMNFSSSHKQVEWLDSARFAVSDCVAGRRGLRIFSRAGANAVEIGFFDVWGAGSESSLAMLFYAQFIREGGGLFCVAADSAPSFSSLYIRRVAWQGGVLNVGAARELTSGYDTGSGSGAQANLVKMGDGEWTLAFTTVVDMRFMSFAPSADGVSITRGWRTFSNENISGSVCDFPVCFGNRISVLQKGQEDSVYSISEILLTDDGFELVEDAESVSGFTSPSTNFCALRIDGNRLLLAALGAYYNVSQLAVVKRRGSGEMLRDVVSRILRRSGYADDEVYLAELPETEIEGFALASQSDADSAVAPLKIYEPFDLVEGEDELKAVPYANISAVELSDRDFCENSELADGTETARKCDENLPAEMAVEHIDAARDYETGTQRARRISRGGDMIAAKAQLPIVCSAQKAKKVAEDYLSRIWSYREEKRFNLTKKWAVLEPGDVLERSGRRYRVLSVEYEKDFVSARVVPYLTADGGDLPLAESGGASLAAEISSAYCDLHLMDLPPLRDADDQPGFYAAVGGGGNWGGASLWRSFDGANYSNIGVFDVPATTGVALSALPDAPSHYMDRRNSVEVQLLRGELESCSLERLLNGANAALLGGEIIQFQNAVLTGDGLYRLENLLRGRKATEEKAASHVIGEDFVLLSPYSSQFFPAQLQDRGRRYYFKSLANGMSLGSAAEVEAELSLASVRPFPPVHIKRAGDANGDAVISWKRRARVNAEWVDCVDVPLDEPYELYDVEIMDGENVKRVFSSVAATSVVYTALQQSADWSAGAPQQFTVNVYQIGSRYGRGQRASAVV